MKKVQCKSKYFEFSTSEDQIVLTMKMFVALLLIALASVAIARPSELGVDSQLDREAYQRCLDTFLAAANNALRGYSSSFKPNQHFLCFSKALGWQKADGSINRENIEANVEKELTYSKAQQFKDECIITKATPELTAGHLFNCAKNYATQQTWLN